MSITVKRLRELLAQYPDDARVNAYEGEDDGLTIWLGDRHAWIRARSGPQEDAQDPKQLKLERSGEH